MKMRWLTILFVLCIACDKEIAFEGFKNKPVAVLQCQFTHDSIFQLNLSQTVDILHNNEGFISVEDAVISVTDSSGNVLELKHIANGNYQSLAKPVIGVNYSLKAVLHDGKTLTSYSAIPASPIGLTTDTSTGPLNRLDIKLGLTNAPGINEYYVIRLLEYSTHYVPNKTNPKLIDSIAGWFPINIVSSNNIFENNVNRNANNFQFDLFNDAFFDGQLYNLNLLVDRAWLKSSALKSKSNAVKVYIKSVPQSTYDYYKGVLKNSNNYGGPFSTHFNPIDNIENGYGIFSGYRHVESVIKVN